MCAFVQEQFRQCTVGQRKKEAPYLFQCKLSYRNKTGTNQHGSLSTSIWCLNFFGGSVFIGDVYPTLIFSTWTLRFDNVIVMFTVKIAWMQIFKFPTLIWKLFDSGLDCTVLSEQLETTSNPFTTKELYGLDGRFPWRY